jgi:hypothetical protein
MIFKKLILKIISSRLDFLSCLKETNHIAFTSSQSYEKKRVLIDLFKIDITKEESLIIIKINLLVEDRM